jgi:hypothetical protein
VGLLIRIWRPSIGRRLVAGFSALALLAAAPTAMAVASSLELAVKATYLYKLAPFVTWPTAGSVADGPLLICVQADEDFSALLTRAASGQSMDGRPFVVRRTPRLDAQLGCRIAYVAGSPEQSQALALRALAGAPVLTVTDEQRGGPARGIVHLVLAGGKVRFAIDVSQAANARLEISSKLLALATAVKR